MFCFLLGAGVVGPPTVVSGNGSRVPSARSDFPADKYEQQLREDTLRQMISSGEKERLRELLRLDLMESNWPEAMKIEVRKVIDSKPHSEVKLDDLIAVLTPASRALVPLSVKRDFLKRIHDLVLESSRERP
jgi:hypothetical protein